MLPSDTSFTLYDSAAQRLLPVMVPRGEPINFYACGITPYAAPHVGHARSFVVFDTLRRVLEVMGWPVRLVRNITDVDDKIIAAAATQGTDWKTVSHGWAAHNRALFARLGVASTEEPTVSDHMSDIVALIATLVKKKHAYVTEQGDVYFEVSRFSGTDVAHQPVDALLSHHASRVASDGKRASVDFALWKATKPGEPAWPSPWGEGRPGWHIECSAMIEALFGRTLTIHGGGTDLRFPHHQCEVCQSEAAFGRPLAQHWVHHGSVLHEGQKMSKSLGNVISVEEALAAGDLLRPGQGAAIVRWSLLSVHWPKPLDWKAGVLDRAAAELDTFTTAMQAAQSAAGLGSWAELSAPTWSGASDFWTDLADNFNVPRAKRHLHQAARVAGGPGEERASAAVFLGQALIALGMTPDLWAPPWLVPVSVAPAWSAQVQALLAARATARAGRDFQRADALRSLLQEQGWDVSDRPEGQVLTAR